MYAELADVLARAGRLSGAWTDESTPSRSDLERFLDSRQGEIDTALASRGVTLPVTSDTAKTALRSLHAAGALVLAISATFPNNEGPAAAASLMQAVTAEWQQGMAGLATGTSATVVFLQPSGEAGVTGATFGDDLDYDYDTGGIYEPVIYRDEVF